MKTEWFPHLYSALYKHLATVEMNSTFETDLIVFPC